MHNKFIYLLISLACYVQTGVWAQADALKKAFQQFSNQQELRVDLLCGHYIPDADGWRLLDEKTIEVAQQNARMKLKAMNLEMYVFDNEVLTVDEGKKALILRKNDGMGFSQFAFTRPELLAYFDISVSSTQETTTTYELRPKAGGKLPQDLAILEKVHILIDTQTQLFRSQHFFLNTGMQQVQMRIDFQNYAFALPEPLPEKKDFFSYNKAGEVLLNPSFKDYTLNNQLVSQP